MAKETISHTQEALLLGRVYQFLLHHARLRRVLAQHIQTDEIEESNRTLSTLIESSPRQQAVIETEITK